MGAATLALINDICSRLGSCSPDCDSSSSLERDFDGTLSGFVFAMLDLLLIWCLRLRLGPRPAVLLDNLTRATDRARRNAPLAGRDRRIDVRDDIDPAAAVTDELVYNSLHCP